MNTPLTKLAVNCKELLNDIAPWFDFADLLDNNSTDYKKYGYFLATTPIDENYIEYLQDHYFIITESTYKNYLITKELTEEH